MGPCTKGHEPMPCQHKRVITIGVMQYPATPDDLHRITFAVSCQECGTEFQFVGGDGGLAFNDERTHLTAWMIQRAS